MKKIDIGIVGVGYLGEFHTAKFKDMPDVRLVGVSDIDPSRGQFIAQKFDVPFYSDHRYLFDQVQAVSIAVPTVDHHTVAVEFLQNGIDVFIEKPFTKTLHEADELIRLGEENNLLIQVGHLERFNPAVIALREAITQPMFIESHRLGFFKERGVDVDVVLDLMIHDLDIILSLVESNILSIMHLAYRL